MGGEAPVYYFSNVKLLDIYLFDMCNYVHVMEEEPKKILFGTMEYPDW